MKTSKVRRPTTTRPHENGHRPGHGRQDSFTMESTIGALLEEGKGILAADESIPTLTQRLESHAIPSMTEDRHRYREMLFTTPSLSEGISGVIMCDETLKQRIDGVSAAKFLMEIGIVPGIKVDMGAVPMANYPGEMITSGLDGLRERLSAYRDLGARFTKWRAVMSVGDARPSRTCIAENARSLALFASLSQEAGLVPIVEPELLMTGDHTIARCESAMTAVLQVVFSTLFDHRVVLENMLLKVGMVLPGEACSHDASVDMVTAATMRCLRRTVPSAVPGIVFLSGGQGEKVATQRLCAICRSEKKPWIMSFSFGRALQESAMRKWQGKDENTLVAQGELYQRVTCNGSAVMGKEFVIVEKEDLGTSS